MNIRNLEECVKNSVESINSIDSLESFLSFCGKGNMYMLSSENLFAVYSQKPDATFVSSFDGWKKYTRYPKKHTGIAIYPFNTSGVYGSFTDYVFDFSDTLGDRNVRPWTPVDEIIESYFEIRKQDQPGRDDFHDFFRNLFHTKAVVAIGNENPRFSLVASENAEFAADTRIRLQYFVAELSVKVFSERCSIPYELSDDAKKTFQEVICPNGGLNISLFSECIHLSMDAIRDELGVVSSYVVNEKRRLKNERESDADRTVRGSGNIHSGAGAGESAGNDRGRSAEGSGNGESSDLSGTGRDTAEPVTSGREDSRVSEGDISGADADSSGHARTGAASGSENQRSESNVQSASSDISEAGERSAVGYDGADPDRESDSSSDLGGDQPGDSVSSPVVLKDNEQLDIFSYLAQKEDSALSMDSISFSENDLAIQNEARMTIAPFF